MKEDSKSDLLFLNPDNKTDLMLQETMSIIKNREECIGEIIDRIIMEAFSGTVKGNDRIDFHKYESYVSKKITWIKNNKK